MEDRRHRENREQRKGQERSRAGKILGLVLLLVFLAAIIAVALPLVKLAKDPEALEAYIEAQGFAGIWIFMGLVILQIFSALVPGGPFEIAAGFLYGPIRGALICDIAMMVGSTAVFLLSRKFGRKFVRLYLSDEQIQSVHFLTDTSGRTFVMVFLLFLIPGTPKDVLSYVVGLTSITLPQWLLITGVGRFPAIVLSTLGGDALESGNLVLFVVMLLIIGVLSVGGIVYYRKINGDRPLKEEIPEQIAKIRERINRNRKP
ncbi:MAG: TVP38/TMEM64 family protein [Lachnospiraceae bacterium]|jgi:uncharacterized membrane protein YdjX (TVP38/TMEM64 family)|nr:TVP38/TMEM64 family protein [Lachnospiraceae bacterium]MCI1397166.1 TVP38/TMEM64 family protein [Lachnospiraceae bacterium]MCI1422804.1 TVP38/TMEM64 family protein [Lachnospiraceae bacterium]MCI1451507.1 TVP38/TMEM64 family protein [Lachnospiraceae bacterium]